MGFKSMALVLLGLLLISCSLIQAYSQDQSINKALQLDHPAASTTDETFLTSFGKHKALRSRKLLVEGEALREKKVGRSSNKSPEGSHVQASKIGSDDELTEKQASSIWTTRAIQVVTGEDKSNLEKNEKQHMRTSLKSFMSSLLKTLHKRPAVLKVSSKKMSGRTLASKNVIPDSNSERLSPASPLSQEKSQTFFNSHSTKSTDYDDNGEITRMDYTPAQRKPPIHNETLP